METISDLYLKRDDMTDNSSQQWDVVKREDVIIGDLEEMELTSRNYKIKIFKTKKFCNTSLVRIFFFIIFFYLTIIFLYPILANIQNTTVWKWHNKMGI